MRIFRVSQDLLVKQRLSHRIHAIGRVSPAFKSNEILIVGYTITVIFGPKSSKIGRSEGLSGNYLKIRFLNWG